MNTTSRKDAGSYLAISRSSVVRFLSGLRKTEDGIFSAYKFKTSMKNETKFSRHVYTLAVLSGLITRCPIHPVTEIGSEELQLSSAASKEPKNRSLGRLMVG